MTLRDRIDGLLVYLGESDHITRPNGAFIGGEDERRLTLDLDRGHAALRTAYRHATRARQALDHGDTETASLWLSEAEACLIGLPVTRLKAAPVYGASKLDRDVALLTLTNDILRQTGKLGVRGAAIPAARIVLDRNPDLSRQFPSTDERTLRVALKKGKLR